MRECGVRNVHSEVQIYTLVWKLFAGLGLTYEYDVYRLCIQNSRMIYL